MTKYVRFRNTALATVVVLATVAAVTVVGAGALVVGTQEAAAAHDSAANYTVTLPNEDDHLPGDQNPEGASIKHNAAGGESFDDVAPNGFETFDRLELQSDHVDFSACTSENTAVFGVDRGNNNPGTQTDDSLLQHMKDSTFSEDSLEVVFYDEGDLGGSPTHLNPEDAIVALQGAGSSGGPCFTMPTEPGWYQISGTLEGTNHDGESVTIESKSHYFPICEGCHDEATAEEKLGPAPSKEGGDPDPTPTATETPVEVTATEEPGEATPTATATPEGATGGDSTATATEASGDETPAARATEGGSAGGAQGDHQGTPTPGGGPGFDALAALLALLAGALLVRRQ
ncbi:hypothetical protein HWV07_10955 [Natronomonas salina]|uniref:hypothetical protein n=1 Tax=Natronomonas salina TaxID=1710540 RepID=UPI0015B6924F|nr:hypothetical protein [Natronomonas salina]QLD89520.1 hypothetical protein HWV07_10955 [Natronomonas salina]